MAPVLDPSSVKLTVTPSRGHPTFVHLGTARALFFCAAGGVNLKIADADAPPDLKHMIRPALTWEGEVSFTGDPRNVADLAELRTRWKFGFLQVSTTFVEQSIYAGRIASDGSMVADKKLAYTPNPCIDPGDQPPFTADPALSVVEPGTSAKAAFKVLAEDEDHPNFMLPFERQNAAAPATNFLFSGRRDEAFTTVFVAIDPAGRKTFLAHFNWHVIWHVQFKWKSGVSVPSAIPIDLRMDIGPVTMGPPTDGATLAVCTNPGTKGANDMDADGEIDIWGKRKSPLLTQSKTRASDIPADFFT